MAETPKVAGTVGRIEIHLERPARVADVGAFLREMRVMTMDAGIFLVYRGQSYKVADVVLHDPPRPVVPPPVITNLPGGSQARVRGVTASLTGVLDRLGRQIASACEKAANRERERPQSTPYTENGWVLPDGSLRPFAEGERDRAASLLPFSATYCVLLEGGRWLRPASISWVNRAQAEAIAAYEYNHGNGRPWPDWFKPADWFADWTEDPA